MEIARSRRVAYAAIFGALAGITTAFGPDKLLKFPVLSYLLIDPAEIIDMLAFFIAGPIIALPTAFIHFLVLIITANGDIFALTGAPLKLAAVLSSFAGMSLGLKLYNSVVRRSSYMRYAAASSFLVGALVRVLIMSVVNAAYIYLAGPLISGSVDNLFGFLQGALVTVGIHATGAAGVLYWVLLITGIYNILQFAVATVPTYFLLRYLVSFGADGLPSSMRQIWTGARVLFTRTPAKSQ